MRLKLQTYLFLCLGVMTVMPVLVSGGLRAQKLESIAIAQSERETSLAAEALAREVAQLMQSHTDAVAGLARQVEAAGTLDPVALQPIVTAQHLASATFGNMWVADSAAISLAVDPPTDAQGRPSAGTNYSDRDYYKKVSSTNATAYSRAQLGRTTHRPNLQVVEPIRDRSGSFIAFAQGAVDLAQIQDLATRISARSPGLRAIVLDAEGRTLAHPSDEARSSMREMASVALYRPSVANDVEQRFDIDEDGAPMRASVYHLPLAGLDWIVIIGRTESAVQAHAAQARLETILTAVGTGLVGLLLAGALSALLARPITRLSALAGELGAGNYSSLPPKPPAFLPREFGTLLDAVRGMVLQLRARTAELDATMQRLAHQSLHDALTGLPNRVLLHERLSHALDLARRNDSRLALLVIDLDRFKEVNDTLGHEYGDAVLCEVAARLHQCLRQSDTVARLGGDEFAVLLPGADLAGANAASRKLLSVLEEPFSVDDQPIDVGGSIGIALYPDHGLDVTALLRQADVAMYAAKAAGTGQASYAPEQDGHRRDRLALIGELRNAISRDELVLHYQPKVALTTGRLVAVEALARWQHPHRGLVPPDDFIPLAEQTGLIKPFSFWVLNTALRQCRTWLDGNMTLQVAVNLSMRNLHDPELPETITQLLECWRVPAGLLRIEVTESSLMNDAERAMHVLGTLREMGVQVDIDDFGTGYSSLGYLKQLPVSQIKIDRSFVADMAQEKSDLAIVRSTVDLAHNLGLEVVAEGVEDRPTWDLLAALGCDVAQGYYLSRPLPASELLQWIAESPWQLDQTQAPAGRKVRSSADLRTLCFQHLMRLRDLTGESARLYVAAGLERICLDEVGGGQLGISTAGVGGSALPLYVGAASKVLLAFLSADMVAAVEEQMAPATDNQSIERRAVLRADLDRIRAHGFATSVSPDGIASIAAPLRDSTGGAMAALTVVGPSYRWTADRIQAFAPVLLDVAEQISRQLGYTPATLPLQDELPKAA